MCSNDALNGLVRVDNGPPVLVNRSRQGDDWSAWWRCNDASWYGAGAGGCNGGRGRLWERCIDYYALLWLYFPRALLGPLSPVGGKQMQPPVRLEVRQLREGLATARVLALKGLFPCVNPHVRPKIVLQGEPLPTIREVAGEGPLLGVDEHVALELGTLHKSFAALWLLTHEALGTVDADVLLEAGVVAKLFAALIADVLGARISRGLSFHSFGGFFHLWSRGLICRVGGVSHERQRCEGTHQTPKR